MIIGFDGFGSVFPFASEDFFISFASPFSMLFQTDGFGSVLPSGSKDFFISPISVLFPEPHSPSMPTTIPSLPSGSESERARFSAKSDHPNASFSAGRSEWKNGFVVMALSFFFFLAAPGQCGRGVEFFGESVRENNTESVLQLRWHIERTMHLRAAARRTGDSRLPLGLAHRTSGIKPGADSGPLLQVARHAAWGHVK